MGEAVPEHWPLTHDNRILKNIFIKTPNFFFYNFTK